MNLCFSLLETAALLAIPADIEITEAHHRHKVDSRPGHGHPHGRGRGHGAEAEPRRLRVVWPICHGVGGERPRNAIGFSVIRAA